MGRARISVAVTALGAAAIFAGGGEAGSMAATQATAAKKTTKVQLRESKFGKVLFAGNGRVLYLFTSDTPGTSNCSGECAAAWPPFYARGRLVAGDGVNRKLLGRTTRPDGRKQVTYKGHPLYFYVHDPRGQVLCNNVQEFGGTWYALNAAGDPPT
jgi:predicted lipoprotein with Yx(FWY)xxD motif